MSEDHMPTESGEVVVAPEKLDSFLTLLRAEVDDEGYIRDVDTGDRFPNPDGEFLTTDEIGYIKYGDEQRLIPLRDNFADIVSGLSDREFREE